jgi:hypothetical protein
MALHSPSPLLYMELARYMATTPRYCTVRRDQITPHKLSSDGFLRTPVQHRTAPCKYRPQACCTDRVNTQDHWPWLCDGSRALNLECDARERKSQKVGAIAWAQDRMRTDAD